MEHERQRQRERESDNDRERAEPGRGPPRGFGTEGLPSASHYITTLTILYEQAVNLSGQLASPCRGVSASTAD